MRRGKSRRRRGAVFMALAVIASMILSVTAAPDRVVKSGDGGWYGHCSREHPYLIKDVNDYLRAVQNIKQDTLDAGAHYTVVNDIDFSGLSDTEKIEIDEEFNGVWDGGGHVFKNLGPSEHSQTSTWMQAVGKEGTVKNLTFENNRFINLISSNYGTIDNCAAIGDYQGKFEGLTYENTGRILNCYNTAPMNGGSTQWTGAITQNNNKGGLVANCYNRGAFKGLRNASGNDIDDGSEAGGLVIFNEGRVYNCYNTGKPDNAEISGFGPVIYYEVSDEPGTTVENGFYPDSLEKWSKLPCQDRSVGTMLADEQMRSDGGLLKRLNEGVGKANAEGLGLRYWERNDKLNDGYPTFIDTGAEYGITVESQYGAAELAYLDGTKAGETAPARIPLTLTVVPEEGRIIEKITLLKSSGGTLRDFPASDPNQEVFTVQFAMPEEDCILKVDYYQFLKDGDACLIGDYPALLSAARAVNGSDYFASANFRLTADIRGEGQEWPVPIGSGREYSGTFDGAGFSIVGFWFEQDQMNGGIFDTIGEKGTVKNLNVFGFTVKSNLYAGGIAAVNQGTIDNCGSGTTQPGERSSSELNSSVSAGRGAGGITGTSTGRILNSRSGADVYGSRIAGGIAGELSGHAEQGCGIFNSCAAGSVSSESTAGGIAARAKGNIENVYFAGNFKKSPAGVDALFRGDIVGEHTTETLKNCYFLDSAAPVDSQAQKLPGTEPVTEALMRSRSFADTLNEGVTEPEYDYWTQNTDQGNGYPYQTKYVYEERTVTDPATGITLSGKIHIAARTDIRQLAPEDEGYKVLQKYVDGQKLNQSYYIGLAIPGKDEGGSAFEDSVVLSFPLAAGAKESGQWVVHYNGEKLQVYKNTQIQGGRLEVRVEALHTFGIINEKTADETHWDDEQEETVGTGDEKPEEKETAGTGDEKSEEEEAVGTGDAISLGFLAAMLFISIIAMSACLYFRKNKGD